MNDLLFLNEGEDPDEYAALVAKWRAIHDAELVAERSGQGPLPRPDANAEPSGAIIALLTVAKKHGLRKWQISYGELCPGSTAPQHGWYAQANYAERAVAWQEGGPWSVEFVGRVCELGLLGIKPADGAERADITKAGRAFLKAQQAEATPQPSEARGRTDANLTPGTNQSKLKEERS